MCNSKTLSSDSFEKATLQPRLNSINTPDAGRKKADKKFYVLHADDDLDDCFLLAEIFQQYLPNIGLHDFNNGQQLLNYLEQKDVPNPSVIIMDINMPMMNGKETLLRLRSKKQWDDIPVVFFTTSSSVSDQLFAQQYNAAFITKPVSMKQFCFMVEYVRQYCPSAVVH